MISQAAIILVRTQTPEIIGAVARAMANMGLKRLIVVSPEKWEAKPMEALAVRAAQGPLGGLFFNSPPKRTSIRH